MKKLLAALLLLMPMASVADHYDVIEFKLKPTCSMTTYMAIVKEFNMWAKDHGYQTEIAVKIHQADPGTHIWLGLSANAGAFGKAYDSWTAEVAKAGTVPSGLSKRFGECTELVNRRSYDAY